MFYTNNSPKCSDEIKLCSPYGERAIRMFLRNKYMTYAFDIRHIGKIVPVFK